MKIAAINSLPKGSPATIMRGVLHVAERETGAEIRSYYGNWKGTPPEDQGSQRFGFWPENALSALLSKYLGLQNVGSVLGTAALLRQLNRFQPDLVHLHNLHLWCVNIPMLFHYLKKNRIPVVWTLHDCWAFTGHCAHYTLAGCDRWKTGCGKCPQKQAYPQCYLDTSASAWNRKRRWFSGLPKMTLVTPSDWLASEVKQSFLKDYPLRVIHNGIDLSVFHPTEGSFREQLGIGERFLLLGVAYGWNERKGLDVFVELARRLDPAQYRIVLVGTDERVERLLPPEIISIRRTHDQKELAELYTAADLFVNPTREDNYPTVNLESIACGTPVLTFRTGGSPEMLNAHTGVVVERGDTAAMLRQIRRIREERPCSSAACVEAARAFDQQKTYRQYSALYRELL